MTNSFLWSIKYSVGVEGAQPRLAKVVADNIQQAITIAEEHDDRDVVVTEVVLIDTVTYQA